MLLSAGARDFITDESNIGTVNMTIANTMIMISDKCMDYIASFGDKPKGDLLEVMFQAWIKVRLLVVSLDPPSASITIQNLFDIDPDNLKSLSGNAPKIDILKKNSTLISHLINKRSNIMPLLNKPFGVSDVIDEVPICSSVKDFISWKKELNSADSNKASFLLPNATSKSKNERYNLGIFMNFIESNEKYLCFMDCKSSAEKNETTKPFYDAKKNKFHQYLSIC